MLSNGDKIKTLVSFSSHSQLQNDIEDISPPASINEENGIYIDPNKILLPM